MQSTKVYITKLYRESDATIYHTNKDYRKIRSSKTIQEKPMNALPKDIRGCQACANDMNRGNQHSRKCPFCGDSFGKLPSHLPCPKQ